MKSLLARIFATRSPGPVFAQDEDITRVMRIAELKWLLAEIAAPSEGGSAWQA